MTINEQLTSKCLKISEVAPGSIAGEIGIEHGDCVVSVNGFEIHDILDYKFYTSDNLINIKIRKENGELWELEIEKDDDQDLGLSFSATGLEKITQCRNKCIFCFVDQMPKGLRDTLYVKDDDYRLSFTQGSFITMTGLAKKDMDRIIRLKLSPLYVSVHTTNPELRKKILGNNKAGDILDKLATLAGAGIEIHTQAVICPGINDGPELDKTVADLSKLWPGVKSLALVPVGLTRFRQGLFRIEKFTASQAVEIVDRVKEWQEHCLKTFGYPFVYASDEFYFLAGKKIPSYDRYADFPQIENGVGLARLFLEEWSAVEKKLPAKVKIPLSVVLVTGILGKPLIKPVVEKLNKVNNLKVSMLAIENHFFGPSVTVAGLLTGSDLISHRQEIEGNDLAVLPSAMFKADCPITIDGITLDELEKKIGVIIRVSEGPEELLETILGITGG